MTSNNVSKLLDSHSSVGIGRMEGTRKSQNVDSPFCMFLSPQTSSGSDQSTARNTDSDFGVIPSGQTKFQKDMKITQKSSGRQYEELSRKLADKTEDFSESVSDVLKEKLGVTDEELQQAMENLNLTFLDLTDPANLANLVAELTGEGDAGSLLFSEDFQMLLSDCRELTQSLLQELGITQEDLNSLLAQMKQGSHEPEAGVQPGTDQAAGPAEEQQEETVTQPSDHQNDLEETVKNTTSQTKAEAEGADEAVKETLSDQPEEQVTTVKSKEGEAKPQNQETAAQKTETNSGQHTGQENTAKDDGKGQNPQMNYQNVQTTTTVTSAGQEVTHVFQQTYVDAESIMRQVLEFTKIQLKPMESSIEMQLNPENLGKVYLHVASREGSITAQLAAQNEAVKEVLESQIAQLKESLNQQGLKVEAVEVTIASHEFEQNLEGNGQSQAGEEGSKQEKARRNLMAGSLDELDGVLSEEENLAAKMMVEQGNSMDMTA